MRSPGLRTTCAPSAPNWQSRLHLLPRVKAPLSYSATRQKTARNCQRPARQEMSPKFYICSVTGIPIAHKATHLPDFYLSSLHWRANPMPPTGHDDLPLAIHSSVLRPEYLGAHANVSLSGEELREGVAKRHNQINLLLVNV